jgi:hypothetical protein
MIVLGVSSQTSGRTPILGAIHWMIAHGYAPASGQRVVQASLRCHRVPASSGVATALAGRSRDLS